jgi:hypothetical protein
MLDYKQWYKSQVEDSEDPSDMFYKCSEEYIALYHQVLREYYLDHKEEVLEWAKKKIVKEELKK